MTDNRGPAIILSKGGGDGCGGGVGTMTADMMLMTGGRGGMGVGGLHSPDSDCNSNPQQPGSASCLSNTSSQDIDFIQDNSDYQWFLDYGYRDNNHTSILSLAESYEAGDIGYYDALAKNMDANLAEADIESFRTEDIHALLTNLPPMCTDQLSQENNRQGESYASISGSMIGKFDFDDGSSVSSPHSSSRGGGGCDDSTSMSICKSELLFSPVREAPSGGCGGGNGMAGGAHFSVDSLDCDLLTEHDILLTCQANKDNYTIAFEGSMTMYSEEYDDNDADKSNTSTGASSSLTRHWTPDPPPLFTSTHKPHHHPLPHPRLLHKALTGHHHNNTTTTGHVTGEDNSMSQSDSGSLTTWSKLKKRSGEGQPVLATLRRHPSGNNNNSGGQSAKGSIGSSSGEEGHLYRHVMANVMTAAAKSQSMPDLYQRQQLERQQQQQQQLQLQEKQRAQVIQYPLNSLLVNKSQLNASSSSTECCTIKRKPVKVFNIQHQSTSGSGGSILSDMATSVDGGSTSSAHSKQQHFSLVKLFMKQKSISAEGMSTALDHSSSASENWPDLQSGDSHHSSHHPTQIIPKTTQPEEPQSLDDFVDSLLITSPPQREKAVDTSEITNNKPHNTDKQHQNSLHKDLSHHITENNHSSQVSNNNNSNTSLELSGEDYTKLQQQRKLKTRSTNTKRKAGVQNSTGSCLLSSDSNSSNCFTNSDRYSKLCAKNVPMVHLMNKSIQTSTTNLGDVNTRGAPYKLNCNSKLQEKKYKVVGPTFLSKLKQEADEASEKPVYICYPNYVLPNLDFLTEVVGGREAVRKIGSNGKVYLVPQRMAGVGNGGKKRPFSCNDVEALKRRGFSHVEDWDSLNFLLPNEYQQILAEVPEVAQHVTTPPRRHTPLTTRHKSRPLSHDFLQHYDRTNSLDRALSSTTSTSSGQPSNSSGYRGSSTLLLTDEGGNTPQSVVTGAAKFNPLFVYRYDSVTSSETSVLSGERQQGGGGGGGKYEVVPPRPPLPRGILRKNPDVKLRQQQQTQPPNTPKRYSMFEMTEAELLTEIANKRRSLHDPPLINPTTTNNTVPRNRRLLSETEDEGVDAGTTSSSSLEEQHDHHHPPLPSHRYTSPTLKHDVLFSNVTGEELAQLEEFLQLSGISGMTTGSSCGEDTSDLSEEGLLSLRSYVSKFLALKINQEKRVSFAEKMGGVGELLAVRQQQQQAPHNSPSVSAMMNQRQCKTLVDMPICEEGESTPENFSSPKHQPVASRPVHTTTTAPAAPSPTELQLQLSQKYVTLASAVTDAVERVIHNFSSATNQPELNELGDSTKNPTGAKLALTTLCPALYAVLSDGLKPSLETSFGPIGNSVWQVVEASAQQGPLTKSLNDLVMRINSEDTITEGLVKFNAFLFGLLNVRSLDAWLSYLRTRETVLRKHYSGDALLVASHTGGMEVRGLVDKVVAAVQPLALLPFQFDLLFEYRLLHESLRKMEGYQMVSPTQFKSWKTDPSLPDLLNSSTAPRSRDKTRPRSCIESSGSGQLVSGKVTTAAGGGFKLGEDVSNAVQKRWSGIAANSKLFAAYSKLVTEDEDYTDSLEATPVVDRHSGDEATETQYGPESLDSNISDDKPLNGRKFKKLQRRWEMLSGREDSSSTSGQSPPPTGGSSPPHSPSHCPRSKIPRPVQSPSKPSGIPVLSPVGVGKKVTTPPGVSVARKVVGVVRSSPVKKPVAAPRTSRLDQLESAADPPRHITRPSSLPYKPNNANSKNSKVTPPRRAISTSVNRKPTQAQSKLPKVVRTLSHRLPSESGHLSYNEGERLKVVLEVDEQWLLCCRGTQKGLVPKSAVIAADPARF